MKLLFFHVIHHFGIGFDRELIENDFKYLREPVENLVNYHIRRDQYNHSL